MISCATLASTLTKRPPDQSDSTSMVVLNDSYSPFIPSGSSRSADQEGSEYSESYKSIFELSPVRMDIPTGPIDSSNIPVSEIVSIIIEYCLCSG